MRFFQIYLTVITIAVVAYTLKVIDAHGLTLFSEFFGDIKKMNWAGQFNTDFLAFLSLSALWLSWRHHFSFKGLLLGICGFFGGIVFLAPYLVFHSVKSGGDMAVLFLGERRAKS